MITSFFLLELRKYNNDSIQSKKSPILKLPLLFITYAAREKERQFQSWIFFTEWSRSYIVLALEGSHIKQRLFRSLDKIASLKVQSYVMT